LRANFILVHGRKTLNKTVAIVDHCPYQNDGPEIDRVECDDVNVNRKSRCQGGPRRTSHARTFRIRSVSRLQSYRIANILLNREGECSRSLHAPKKEARGSYLNQSELIAEGAPRSNAEAAGQLQLLLHQTRVSAVSRRHALHKDAAAAAGTEYCTLLGSTVSSSHIFRLSTQSTAPTLTEELPSKWIVSLLYHAPRLAGYVVSVIHATLLSFDRDNGFSMLES